MELPDFLPTPDVRALTNLRDLAPDTARELLDDLDWKSAASLCHILPGPCRQGYWKRRTIREFGEKEWIVSYKYDFHNYLAARVRFFSKQSFMDTYFTSPIEKRLKLSDFEINSEMISGERATTSSSKKKILKIMELRQLFHQIKDHELRNGYTFPHLPDRKSELAEILRDYFNPSPSELQLTYIKIYEISHFLADYLKKNYPDIFTEKKITIRQDDARKYFSKTKEILEAPPGTHISTNEGTISGELAEDFLENYPLKPDNLGLIYSEIRPERVVGYLFVSQDMNIHWVTYLTNLVISPIFKLRMKELGIIPSCYHILYPRFK